MINGALLFLNKKNPSKSHTDPSLESSEIIKEKVILLSL